MIYPDLNVAGTQRLITDEFRGYNHNLRISDGEWYDETNLTSSYYPLFSQRDKHGVVAALSSPQGLLAKDALMYVDGASVYYNGAIVPGITLSTAAAMCPKTLVSMGAYAVIFPDKKYINTKDLTDTGSLENTFTSVSGVSVSYQMCAGDGTNYELSSASVSDAAPENPDNGDYWIDTSKSVHSLKQYSSTQLMWQSVASCYVKISADNIGAGFAVYDGITISGISGNDQLSELNTDSVIYACGNDYIVVPGILDQAYTQTSGSVTVSRTCPQLDFVTESENRLWGCHYGMANGTMVNEIYACKLGDFRNWNCYMGLSTDSYAVSVGTDGKFTGAVTHQGYPIFFKEMCLHKIYGSQPSSYQVKTTMCRGVQEGSERSLAIVNETLYYKSRVDICAYDGAMPAGVSDALGQASYQQAAAGAYGGKYYVSMTNDGTNWDMFVFDTERGIWHRESGVRALAFAQARGDLFYIDKNSGNLISVTGSAGTAEPDITWSATSGIMAYEYPDAKYISRYNIRCKLSSQASVTMYIQYDSTGDFINMGTWQGSAVTSTVTIPVIPHRCDHLRIRLAGTGDVKIFSIARLLEEGSDA